MTATRDRTLASTISSATDRGKAKTWLASSESLLPNTKILSRILHKHLLNIRVEVHAPASLEARDLDIQGKDADLKERVARATPFSMAHRL